MTRKPSGGKNVPRSRLKPVLSKAVRENQEQELEKFEADSEADAARLARQRALKHKLSDAAAHLEIGSTLLREVLSSSDFPTHKAGDRHGDYVFPRQQRSHGFLLVAGKITGKHKRQKSFRGVDDRLPRIRHVGRETN